MEVAVAEEKKKIFRARKTMKISDRQQLETLHSTLLSSGATLSNPSPPPMQNGRHKEDGHKALDKERHDTSDSQAMSPTSPGSCGSPTPSLSLNLSPSPPICEATTFPTSPFRSLNFDLGKSADGVMEGSPSNGSSAAAPTQPKAGNDAKAAKMDTITENKKDEKATAEPPATDSSKESGKNSVSNSSPPTPPPIKKVEKDGRSESGFTQDMEVVGDTTIAKNSTAKTKTDKPSSPKPSPSPSTSTTPMKQHEIKVLEPKEEKKVPGKSKQKDAKDEVIKDVKEDGKKGATKAEKMEVDFVKVDAKKEKKDAAVKTPKSFRPSFTPLVYPDVQEKSNTVGLKRVLSEGEEKEKEKVERDGKRPKIDGVELEAQLELKITAKAGSRLKLEKVVQQLVEDRLRVLQQTVFDQNLQELKERVLKIDSATKHQSTLNTLQAKISRLTKKFGEANQALENKRKQEVIAAATAAATATAATSATTAAAMAVQTAAAVARAPGPSGSPSIPRLVRTSMEIKQTMAGPASATTTTTATPAQSLTTQALVPATSVVSAHTPILQLITSSANTLSSLTSGSITTQSPTGTLLVKATSGSGMVGQGQQLLIQLPLVSSFSAGSSLNKAKTTTPTTTFILKPATATVMTALQNSTGQMSPAQISLARAVYQGGAGGIGSPNAGVSITTARAPAQLMSVAGAVTSTLSLATSGPAATGSTAPGPPQGTSLTSKTDNQTPSGTPTKVALSTPRPKGSVIDLTEDDDDVQVMGVKKATVPPSPVTARPVITIPNNPASRSSPQIHLIGANSPQVTVHHPPVDRPATTPTSRPPPTVLPPLPMAQQPVGRLPIEAIQTSPPQQPQLKLVPSPTGIVLSWCVAETDRSCAAVDSYHLFAFHQDNANSNSSAQQHWKRIGEVKALPLPMACTLTQFQSGSTYHFAVRAKDIYGRFGSFCEPQCTNVIHSNTS
ncbi:activating transcription factor 7-interacting protein 1 [Gadus morhua]|uniref:Activating transcription factor 7 interacting protein n=1 Tax=Gadus morhua TaxID=8049 RepID=A0A8C5CNT8_GADMO|nr:activating transcription factor 7-interacting protein 1-like [Gadus morhua]